MGAATTALAGLRQRRTGKVLRYIPILALGPRADRVEKNE